ncbi:hypothetical protein [Streptomyces sp. CdTB01]|uniref:hypothetical protein n=1 Tax=Streptomyces sp. CdTB01 TaxID=1725411 RepID=UPI00073AE1ED|nr:hypothetical protein [Streptomyces sp. CdTB01]ALV31454.1 hypothetical protein AS200_04835 [Streptomyces sp. CdTB01]
MQSPAPRSRFTELSTATVHPGLAEAEHSRLSHVLAARSTLRMAEGALMVLGPMPLDDAARCLVGLSRMLTMHAHVVAEHVLDLVQGKPVPAHVGDALQAVLSQYRT